jgi:hypothetical protein
MTAMAFIQDIMEQPAVKYQGQYAANGGETGIY